MASSVMEGLVLDWRLTRRLIRARWLRRAVIPTVVVAAVLTAVAMTMSAWEPTANQRLARDLGAYDVEWRIEQPAVPGVAGGLPTGSPSEGAGVFLRSDRLSLPASSDRVVMTEGPWVGGPFPEVYSLEGGRWPQRPGEVAVSAEVLAPNGVLTVSPDIGPLRVVGRVNNAFSDQAEFLAAPGTWAAATTRSGTSAADVAADAFLFTGVVDPAQAQVLAGGLAVMPVTRRDEVRAEQRTWTDRSPFAYRVPAALLPALAGAACLLLSRRRVEAFHGGLLDVGASRRRATSVLAGAGSLGVAVAGAAGVACGAVAGAAGAFLMAQLAIHPVHVALPTPAGVVSAILPAVVGWLVALLVVGRSRTARRGASLLSRVRSRHGALIRDTALLGLLAVSAVLAVVGRSPAEAMILAALLGVLTALAGPRILSFLARALPEGDPAIRWVRRSITAPRSATPLSFALLLALMVPCITTAVFVNLSGSQVRADALSDVGPGQVAVHGVGGLATPPPEALRRVADTAFPGGQQHELMWVDGFLSMEFPNAAILVVPDAQDVRKILGSGVSETDAERVGAGGTLYWGADAGSMLTVSTADGDTGLARASRVEGVSEEWQTQSGAIMALTTARQSDLPLLDGGLLFTGATAPQISSLYALLDAAGLDRRAVSAYEPPRAVLPPLALIASATLLALVVVTVATATSSTRTTLMRPVAAQFVAQGGSRHDVRRLVLTEQALVLIAAAVAALLIALGSAGVLLMHNSGLDLNLQGWPIAGVVLAAGAGQVLAALGALKGLRANDAGPLMQART